MATLQEVFGISSKPVLSYVEREEVDGKFVEALASDRHVIVYGSSKQGKTALRQKHIPDDKCVIVRCGTKSTIETIYQAILRDTNVKIEVFETKTQGLKAGAKAKWGFKAILPLFGAADTEAEVSGEANTQTERQSQFVGFDLSDAQSITELLAQVRYRKYVVVENFHYLPEETQKQVAFDLKTFHEVSIRFVILGIWREANYLLMYNGDLQDRMVEIPVEPWGSQDFDKVIATGCKALNISIIPDATEQFKDNAYGNIGMLQEFLKIYCRLGDIVKTRVLKTELNKTDDIGRTFEEKLADQRGRLTRVLETLAAKGRTGTHSDTPLILPYFLVKVLLTTPVTELIEGIRRTQLLDKLRQVHYRDEKDTIRASDLSNLLKRLPHYQEEIQPPFLYYDSNQSRLKIVDSTQFFVLARVNRDEIWDEIPNPLETYDE